MPAKLNAWLEARARPVYSAEELDGVVGEIQPLVDLLAGKPDPSAWNAPTWKAFQSVSSLSPEALTNAASALDGSGAPIPPILVGHVHDPEVNRATLARLLRVRAFAQQVVSSELPSLLPEERQRYLGLVHDAGYAEEQLARTRDSRSLLCAVSNPGVLDPARLALLSPDVADRFADKTRVRVSHGLKVDAAVPKLNLKELIGSDGSPASALTFLQLSGKDVDAPSADLHGRSMREFLQRTPEESQEQWLSRLEGKQVLNDFSQTWQDLRGDVERLEQQGANGGALRSYLEKKQTAALAPALLLLNAPSLVKLSYHGSSEKLDQTLDGLMQVFWRACSPYLDASDPLVRDGVAQLQQSHGEQLAKDRKIWTSVIGLQKTRILAGLRDQTYESRTAFLQGQGVEEPNDHIAQALDRVVRDLGPDNPVLRQTVSGLDLSSDSEAVRTELQGLRFDPRAFTLNVPPGLDSLRFGGATLSFQKSAQGQLLPEFVGATTIAYRVQTEDGKSALLRLPKGATPVLCHDGALELKVFDPDRFHNVSNRLADYELLDSRVSLTDRQLLRQGDAYAVVEHREEVKDAGASLREGAQLRQSDVDGLVHQWVMGLGERDPRTHPQGLFYELGPDNYILGKDGLQGSYVDVSLIFRNERERETFGFFNGGYGSAANWIVADNTPLPASRLGQIWAGKGLTEAEQERRQMFCHALRDCLHPSNRIWEVVPAEARQDVRESLRRDAERIGLVLAQEKV